MKSSCAIDLDATADMVAPDEVMLLRRLLKAVKKVADFVSAPVRKPWNPNRIVVNVEYVCNGYEGAECVKIYLPQLLTFGWAFEQMMRRDPYFYADFRITSIEISD